MIRIASHNHVHMHTKKHVSSCPKVQQCGHTFFHPRPCYSWPCCGEMQSVGNCRSCVKNSLNSSRVAFGNSNLHVFWETGLTNNVVFILKNTVQCHGKSEPIIQYTRGKTQIRNSLSTVGAYCHSKINYNNIIISI